MIYKYNNLQLRSMKNLKQWLVQSGILTTSVQSKWKLVIDNTREAVGKEADRRIGPQVKLVQSAYYARLDKLEVRWLNFEDRFRIFAARFGATRSGRVIKFLWNWYCAYYTEYENRIQALKVWDQAKRTASFRLLVTRIINRIAMRVLGTEGQDINHQRRMMSDKGTRPNRVCHSALIIAIINKDRQIFMDELTN